MGAVASSQQFGVQDEGLMSYSPDLAQSFERAAALVARILESAKLPTCVRAANLVSVCAQSENREEHRH